MTAQPKGVLKEFGRRIKLARLERDLTLLEVGTRIGYSPKVASTTIGQVESGVKKIPLRRLPKLAKLLDLEISESDVSLLLGEDRFEAIKVLLDLEPRDRLVEIGGPRLPRNRLKKRLAELLRALDGLEDAPADDVLRTAASMARTMSGQH